MKLRTITITAFAVLNLMLLSTASFALERGETFADSSTLTQEECVSECEHLSYGYRGISRNICHERVLCMVRHWDEDLSECIEDGLVRRNEPLECRDILPLLY